jgi:hypothetical protein
MPDRDGGAVLVDLDEGHRLRRCTISTRDLRWPAQIVSSLFGAVVRRRPPAAGYRYT